MGKKHNKVSSDKNKKTNVIVDIDGDIMHNKKKYEGVPMTHNESDASKLSDMMCEYDKIRENLEKHPTVEDEQKAKHVADLNDAKTMKFRQNQEVLSFDDEELTTEDVIFEMAVVGIAVIGVVALCVAGVKGFKLIKSFL